jgi:6,7-dimethyl-8-ribityllumazine synthase
LRILIVESSYHAAVADHLSDGATGALGTGSGTFTRVSVPGVLELPGAVALASHHRNFDAYVALGCVIGEGVVAQTLYRETMRGLMQLSAQGVVVGNGVIFAPDERAALALAVAGDAGGDAARAALALANLRERLAVL